MVAELLKIGQRADDSVSRRAVGVGHQSLMGALWCTNRAPHLQQTQTKQFLYSLLAFSRKQEEDGWMVYWTAPDEQHRSDDEVSRLHIFIHAPRLTGLATAASTLNFNWIHDN